jgi:hypothetical protein
MKGKKTPIIPAIAAIDITILWLCISKLLTIKNDFSTWLLSILSVNEQKRERWAI